MEATIYKCLFLAWLPSIYIESVYFNPQAFVTRPRLMKHRLRRVNRVERARKPNSEYWGRHSSNTARPSAKTCATAWMGSRAAPADLIVLGWACAETLDFTSTFTIVCW